MEEFSFGLFNNLLEGDPHPLEIDDYEDTTKSDLVDKLRSNECCIYTPVAGDTKLHNAIRCGKQAGINALIELYRDDFDKVKDHLVVKYQWDVEDKIWLRKTILVASTEEQCQSAKNLENRQVDAEAMRRAVLVLLQNPVNGEEVAVLYPNEANRSAVTKLITTLTPNGFLSWNFVSTIGAQETFMQVAASKGSKRVIDRLYELGAPIAIPGHNPLMQAIRNNRKEMVSWLLTEHFDHFDCTMRNSDQHNALIAAIIKNVTGLFDLVLEKMMDYRL
uniref:(northern house mosquito) hypothetical protein n=1 Tax=Culex pipiens TaxID=7175 RepID=A0A8D8CH35_CULPI